MGDQKIRVKITPESGKTIIVYEENTQKLLLVAVTYNKKIKPGEYADPKDIVEIFHTLATRGHETKRKYAETDIYKMYIALAQLLSADLPFADKLEEVLRYARRR